MINRHYFMAVTARGEYGYVYYTIKSFFPDVDRAFEFGLNELYECEQVLPEDSDQRLTVIAFNRV